MADAHEADRPGVTAADAVRALFTQLPAPGKDLVWLADQVIEAAQHLGSVSLERSHDDGLACRTEAGEGIIPGRDAARLFRPLLARLAVVGADETGGEPQLYGGRFALARSSRSGPVRLEVEFENTPDSLRLSITRVPVAAVRRSEPPTEAAPEGAPARPSA